MISPYKSYLAEYLNLTNVLIINRNGAVDITGQVVEINDYGCVFKCEVEQPEPMMLKIFVAYEDIRGVGQAVHGGE